MRSVLIHPMFTLETQYVQSFFNTLEYCNYPLLIVLSLSIRELPQKMAPKRVSPA